MVWGGSVSQVIFSSSGDTSMARARHGIEGGLVGAAGSKKVSGLFAVEWVRKGTCSCQKFRPARERPSLRPGASRWSLNVTVAQNRSLPRWVSYLLARK